jgi:ubiquinone biosynthesis protein UbiJ
MSDTAPPGGEQPGFARRRFGHDLLALLEASLNARIGASTAALALVDELDGQSFAVEVLGTGFKCVLMAQLGRVTLSLDAPAPTVTLRATPFDLLRLARSADVADLKGTTAELTGHLHTAEQFAALLKHARPELEEDLSHWVGDVAAHELGRAAARAGAWLGRAAAALRMNTAEYLQEESRALPAALEAQAFYRDVERLRDDVERAAARLARLERR